MTTRARGEVQWTRRRLIVGAIVAAVLVAGCNLVGGGQGNDAPWKSGASAVVETASASGPLAPACPALAQAQSAAPGLVKGPDVNTTVFKTMVLQCLYGFGETDTHGSPAGIDILVFDASAEGKTMWDSVRTDPNFPGATDIAGLADVAFATGAPGREDVWVVQGKYAFHMYENRVSPVRLEYMVALARLLLAGLARVG